MLKLFHTWLSLNFDMTGLSGVIQIIPIVSVVGSCNSLAVASQDMTGAGIWAQPDN